MEEANEKKNVNQQELTEARIMGIVLEDILFRSPGYGIAVALILGSLSYLFVWLTLNILRPLILG